MVEQQGENNDGSNLHPAFGTISVPTGRSGRDSKVQQHQDDHQDVISALTSIPGISGSGGDDTSTTASETIFLHKYDTTPRVVKVVSSDTNNEQDPTPFVSRLSLFRHDNNNNNNNNSDEEEEQQRIIYGRQQQLDQLDACFNKTKKSAGFDGHVDRQLILLEGTAGSGKSSLVYHWKQKVVEEGGFFLGGKYEQSSGTGTGGGSGSGGSNIGVAADEPYVAVTMACRDLCDGLLALRRQEQLQQEPHDKGDGEGGGGGGGGCYSPKWAFTFEQVQAKLLEELEPDVIQVLTTVFPDLTQLFGGTFLCGTSSTTEQPIGTDSNNIGYIEAKEQFKYAIQRLLRVIASFGRIVLFLDDCQWADAASLDLVKNCITDCTIAEEANTAKKKAIDPSAKATSTSTNESSVEGEEMGLMVIASYRSEEMNNSHGLMKTVKLIEKELSSDGTNTPATRTQDGDDVSTTTKYAYEISRILVHNLQMDQVHEMVLDVLRRFGSSNTNNNTLEETSSLASCIYSKTEGNPLYAIQFLESLMVLSSQRQQTETTPLLKYNPTLSKWEFDIEEIRLSASAAQNVIEMIQQKLKRLPHGFQKLLPVVALLGASFDYGLLDRVIRHFNHQVFRLESNNKNFDSEEIRALTPEEFVGLGEKEGVLLMNQTKRKVFFGHDKIREAAFDLAESRRCLAKLGMQLGRFFMTFTQEEQEKNVFIMVNLLTGDEESYKSMTNDNRVFLAELNCKAGIKSIQGSAFTSAEVYLERGVALLPEGHWYDQHDLSLELYSSAAEVYYANGKFAEAERCCQNIYLHLGSNTLETARANVVTLTILNGKEQTDLAQQECIRILADLGCKFPKYGQGLFTVGGIAKIEMTIKSLEKQIQGLPVMTDPTKQWIMRLLDLLATYAYQSNSDIFGLVILKSLQYTLKYGSCDYTPPALSTVGMLLGGVVGDFDGNNRFGKLALEQYNKSPPISRRGFARTIVLAHAFNCHTHLPTWESRKQYLAGYKTGMASGDVESAFYIAICLVEVSLHNGQPLVPLERDIRGYTKQSIALKQEKVAILLFPIWECVTNLLGHTDSMHDMENALKAHIFAALGVTEQTLSEQSLGFITRLTLHNLFYMGNYEEVVSMCLKHSIDKLKWDTGVHMCSHALSQVHFHCAIALFASFHDTKMKTHKKLALKEAKITKKRCKWGNPCLQHYISLVEAELLALDKKSFHKAVELFQEAIRLTAEHKIVHDQALANERLGDFYLRNGKENDAIHHFKEAEKLYEEWGSAARGDVVFSLERRKRLLTGPFVDQSSKLTPTLPPSDIMLVVGVNDDK